MQILQNTILIAKTSLLLNTRQHSVGLDLGLHRQASVIGVNTRLGRAYRRMTPARREEKLLLESALLRFIIVIFLVDRAQTG